MTRIEELEKEIKLIKELIKLRKELNNIPQPTQYPYSIPSIWYGPTYSHGTITCTASSEDPVTYYGTASASGIVTSGYVQTQDLSKMVDGPGSFKTYNNYGNVGWGG